MDFWFEITGYEFVRDSGNITLTILYFAFALGVPVLLVVWATYLVSTLCQRKLDKEWEEEMKNRRESYEEKSQALNSLKYRRTRTNNSLG